ncbi:metallophosphoesterase family protein [Pseudomonas gingeri]|uniref:metallophosphoesterase family protein n=1 Tax=Pseudomonas gingeri TaxID=117681 RepID=UPI00211623F9|nr:metallophosphoesterase family protein [Pseudomonas gingeri]
MLGVLSDAHGNVAGFDQAISVLRGLGATEFIFLGDAVGYIPGAAVLERVVRDSSKFKCILGNHEEMMISGDVPPQKERIYQVLKTRREVRSEDFERLKKWPRSMELMLGVGRCLFLHGSPNDPTNGYVYPDTDLSVFNVSANYVFMGHSHRPFIRQHENVVYVNVGSCGLPRDDGRYGAAALFDDKNGSVRIVRFNIENSLEALTVEKNGLHASVLSLFRRRDDNFFGDLI